MKRVKQFAIPALICLVAGNLSAASGNNSLAVLPETLENGLAPEAMTDLEEADPVNPVAIGHVAQPALHTAALESDLFRSVRLEDALASWTNLVDTPMSQGQLVKVTHGALEAYDLPHFRKSPGEKLTKLSLVNAKGSPVE